MKKPISFADNSLRISKAYCLQMLAGVYTMLTLDGGSSGFIAFLPGFNLLKILVILLTKNLPFTDDRLFGSF